MKFLIALFSVFFLVCSCEKALFKPDKSSSDPLTNFNYLWNEVDKKYSYFELKNIDWDQIKIKYQAKITQDMGEEKLFKVLADMLKELKDDHTNLMSPFDVSRYDVALKNDVNFRMRTIEEFYIPKAMYSGGISHDFLSDEKIGYIRYSSFMNGISDATLDFILKRYKNTKGLILDLRDNGGGNIQNVPLLLERFSSQKTLVGYFKTRNGKNRTDFSEKQSFYIGSYAGVRYEKPLMVLIDRGSFSATTMFSLATKSFPTIKLIGDTTGGGGGLPNGGQLPNGWTYRFSISQLIDLEGNSYAESGVSPNINASFDWSDLTKDEILDRAVLEILK